MAIPLLDSKNLIKHTPTKISATTTLTTRTSNRILKQNQQKFHTNFMNEQVVDKVIIQQLSCTELAWVFRFCIYYFMLS